ncbi:MAG: hypothetical protein ACREO5_13305, partial [Candidatus Binatia bacterium]
VEVIIDQPIAVAGFRPGNLRILSGQVREAIEKHLRRAPRAAEEPPKFARAILSEHRLEKRSV